MKTAPRSTIAAAAPSSFRPLLPLAMSALFLAMPGLLRAQGNPGYANSPQALVDAQQVGQLVDPAVDPAVDPPSRVARLSVLGGSVSFEPAGANDFSAAELNYPLTSGDRLYTGNGTGNGARAELEAGQLTLRLGPAADATVTSLTDSVAQFGLAQGSAHLRAYALDPNTVTELDTPNASVTLLQPGDYRIDVYPQDNVTVVTVFFGSVRIDGDGVQQTVTNGQSLRIGAEKGNGSFHGSPSQAQFVQRARPDDLDRFSAQRDALYGQQMQQNGANINPDTIGYADLGQYGDWAQAPAPDGDGSDASGSSGDYGGGAVWFPRDVAADWQPYSVGHWAYVAPWGWTWIESEPWGFAPFHYGRWARFGAGGSPRWGWIPGPPVVHPVYSPALVVFVGGGGLRVGGGGSGGIAAWFPLGPREVYQPPYRTGPGYVNRINVTNIYNRNTVEVRNVYNNRTVNVYEHGGPERGASDRGGSDRGASDRSGRDGGFHRGPGGGGAPQYANRDIATVAVPQETFAAGRPVSANAIHVDPRQLSVAPIDTRPPAAATRPARASDAADAQPVARSRPVLANGGAAGRAPGAAVGSPAGNYPAGDYPGRNYPGRNDPARGYPVRNNPTRTDPANSYPVQNDPARNGGEAPRSGQPPASQPGPYQPRTGTPAPVEAQPQPQPRQQPTQPNRQPNPGNRNNPSYNPNPNPNYNPNPNPNPNPNEGPKAPPAVIRQPAPVEAPRYGQPSQPTPAPTPAPSSGAGPKPPNAPSRQNGPVPAPQPQAPQPPRAPQPQQPAPRQQAPSQTVPPESGPKAPGFPSTRNGPVEAPRAPAGPSSGAGPRTPAAPGPQGPASEQRRPQQAAPPASAPAAPRQVPPAAAPTRQPPPAQPAAGQKPPAPAAPRDDRKPDDRKP